MKTAGNLQHVMFLAVIPWYRQECIDILRTNLGSDLQIYASDYGLDSTVRTGIKREQYIAVSRRGLLNGKLLVQGIPITVLRARGCVVVDLNPRSISAWAVLLVRRLTRRRVVVWGHLHPRNGVQSKSAVIRRAMRRIADGAILYGYDSVSDARKEIPEQRLWVAANAIYSRNQMEVTESTKPRNALVYVGRLEVSKNVEQLVPAFYESRLWEEGIRLEIVGGGSLHEKISKQAADLGILDAVSVHGQVNGASDLKQIYSRALFSLSPGYVGLSATQSLGFGVPMIYAEDAPHAPEIELKRLGYMRGYMPASVKGLASAMASAYAQFTNIDATSRAQIASSTASFYSAEIMAGGLVSALTAQVVDYGVDGWPVEEN